MNNFVCELNANVDERKYCYWKWHLQMGLCKYVLHLYRYKHIAMNRFASSQANLYHVIMFLPLPTGGTNTAYAVCIHIDLTTHFGTKRSRKFTFTFGFAKLPLSTWNLLNVVIRIGMLVKLTNKSMLACEFQLILSSNIYTYIFLCICVCVCVCVCWSYEQEYKNSNCVSSTRIWNQISEYRGNNNFTVFRNTLRTGILCHNKYKLKWTTLQCSHFWK